jgi:hypothetical protein
MALGMGLLLFVALVIIYSASNGQM